MAVAVWYMGERVTDENADHMVKLKGSKESHTLAFAAAIGTCMLYQQIMIAEATGGVQPEDKVFVIDLEI